MILAKVFRITLEQADVSADSEWEDRNWDAVVTCEYERLRGDLNWSLTVYAANEVEYRPSEKELASLVPSASPRWFLLLGMPGSRGSGE
ncbi:hypothetical protein [Streptomyces prasinopilosus]|uniref:hypothetical protein n=1 Tax=Streptomyces prasinopilosus TaxID=67344 RepID=UPI0012FEDF4C|nr:hypothetical protein [Streptomyces prasinopilosus]